MTAQPVCGADHPLDDALVDAHQRAIDALDAGHQLDAVVWLSAHLAAAQRTLHRAVESSPATRQALDDLRAADRDLERLLRYTEQRHSGDSLAAQLNAGRLETDLRRALDAHSHAECHLVHNVVQRLSAADADELLGAYETALRSAPTRPHPHAPHRGLLGAAAFRIDALRDKVMDTMDGRTVPSPRQSRRTTEPGRWGRYVLGEMHE